jgi:hypothetical protein
VAQINLFSNAERCLSERWNKVSDCVLQSAEGVQNLGAPAFCKKSSMVLDALMGSFQSATAF